MVFKCKHCGKTLYYRDGRLQCRCGKSVDTYNTADNTSEMTCDVCGNELKNNRLSQVCEECGAFIVSGNLSKYKDAIALPSFNSDKAEELVIKYLKQNEMGQAAKKVTSELVYLPYYLVDTAGGKENLAAYTGSITKCKYAREMFGCVKTKRLSKFRREYLAGSESYIGEEREQVITKTINDSLDGDQPKSKMSALLPVYTVNVNGESFFVDGIHGKVYGEVKCSTRKVLGLSAFEAVAVMSVVSTAIVCSGGLMK